MNLIDLAISAGSIVLSLTLIPFLLNKNSQSPRWTSSIPVAVVLTYFIPLFYLEGTVITSITLVGQAVAWWLIAIFRPIKKSEPVNVVSESTENYVI